nr:hypothetical protein BaRGS_029829 [Batillaria attramentaria]
MSLITANPVPGADATLGPRVASAPGTGAWRVVLDAGFLRVSPIQPHFLRRICLAAGSCPARSHSSSFRIFSGHRMLKMRLRQVLRNVWIFCCIVYL